jgi:8-oxo-dGTP pyrophosphatase MutT (NUDIX family)
MTIDMLRRKLTAASDPAHLALRPDPMIAKMRALLNITRIRQAAVLVPIIDRPDGMRVLFTKRSDDLPTHAGQISFPGGKIEPFDVDATAAALREAEEEVGLAPHLVEVLGVLPQVETPSGFVITPIVARVPPDAAFDHDPGEVADLFDVPLAFLLDPDNHVDEQRDWHGLTRRYRSITYGPHHIWGATAAIVLSLADVLA